MLRTLLMMLALAAPLAAQTVTVGSQSIVGGITLAGAGPKTLIDLSHPATADGPLAYASVQWYGKGCTGVVKVKILRPDSALTMNSYSLVGERGPFTAVGGRNQVSLTPPIDVKKGDLIAVTNVSPLSTCAGPGLHFSTGSTAMVVNSDTTTGLFSGTIFRDTAVSARATDTQEVLEGVIAAAGSLNGAAGSHFRTALQIVSPSGGTCTGKLIFHPAGKPFSANDQAIPYTVDAKGVSYDDIVDHMGQSGLGTIDVISNNGYPPLVTARVYNDAGPNGTSGFSEDMIRTTDALHVGDTAILLTPSDLTNFRANIGIRTFSTPLTVNVQYGFRSQGNMTFPANTFQQMSLAAFGDPSPVANEQIYFFMLSGDAVIYMSTTDNRTNDSSVRFARRE